MPDEPNSDEDEQTVNGDVSIEPDGREAHIDIGYYNVKVSGDPGDSIEDIVDAVTDLADRAKADVQELDDRIDDGEGSRTYS